jgi:formyl-CoA transferase
MNHDTSTASSEGADQGHPPGPGSPPPLAGVRVLEVGSFIAGPFAGQLLADYGAEVIKVEPPGSGDPMRVWGVCLEGRSLWWPTIARGKRSIAIDLRQAEGRSLVRRLAESCDVVLENFRPGKLEEWGLGYEELSAANPGLVLVRVSGFGQDGPRAMEPGFGSVGEAMGGLRYTTGFPDRPPARAGISLGDSLAAIFAVVGTLLALHERHRSGRGQVVDVALYEAVFAVMESLVADYDLAGVVRGRSGSVLAGVAPSNIYETQDGTSVLIAANADSIFRRLAEVSDIDAADARFATHQARAENMRALDDLLDQWVGSLELAELSPVLRDNGIPFTTVSSAADILEDQHFLARRMIQHFDAGFHKPVPTAAVVPRLGRTPGTISGPGPDLGQDTDQVLSDLLQLDADEVDHLRSRGVVA